MKLNIKLNIKLIILLLSTFFGMFILNSWTTYNYDDFLYSFKYPSVLSHSKYGEVIIYGQAERVKNFLDIIQSQANHYMMYGGRVFAHTLVQLFLIFPKYIFDFFNSIVFLIMVNGMYINISNENKKKINSFYLFLIFIFLIWFTAPPLRQSYFWLTGSMNYVWTTTFLLYFSYYMKKFVVDKNKTKQNKIFYFVLFSVGILAGWTNENMCVSILVATIIMMYINRKISKKLIYSLIGLFIGSLLVIFAPGNFVRASTHSSYLLLLKKNLKIKIIFFVFSIFSIYSMIFPKGDFFNKLRKHYYEFLIGLFGFGIMFLSPEFPIRARFGALMFLFVFIINMIMEIEFKNIILKKYFPKIIYSCMILLLLISYSNFFVYYKNFDLQVTEREKMLATSEKEIVIPSYITTTRKYMMLPEAKLNTKSSISNLMQNYYNKDKILVLDRYVYDNVYIKDNLYNAFYILAPKNKNKFFENFYLSKTLSGDKFVFLIEAKNNSNVEEIKNMVVEYYSDKVSDIDFKEISKNEFILIRNKKYFPVELNRRMEKIKKIKIHIETIENKNEVIEFLPWQQ
ncbi:MAG: DUF3329 domain-containing protein [Fusobacteriaceae bacterium]